LPHRDLVAPRALGLLREHRLELLFAVRPGDTHAADVLRACRGEGLRAGVWPMLADRDGRWANARNALAFERFTLGLLDALDAAGVLPAEVAIDLEPGFDRVARLVRAEPRAARAIAAELRDERRAFERGREVLGRLASTLAARGVAASAALVPLVALPASGAAWERLLGTPATEVWEHASVMLYTSLLEGWSRGALAREDALAVLHDVALATRARFGARAGLSLGALGPGAFGTEPVYRAPAELADDVAVARAAGVDDLTLLDLGGLLARPDAGAFARAFVSEPARALPPRRTFRARAFLGALELAGRTAAWVADWSGRSAS
jgi:hypothetical protein